MRHNHKNHIRSPCESVFDFLPNGKNQNSTSVTKIWKTALFLPKKRKPQRTTKPAGKTEVFQCKNRKTDLENGQNRKTENRSKAPLDKQSEFLSFTKIYIPFYCSRSGRSLSLENRRSCLTVSKALLKSIANTLTALNPFWSKNVRIWCYIVNGASVQLPPFLLGNCLLSTM